MFLLSQDKILGIEYCTVSHELMKNESSITYSSVSQQEEIRTESNQN